MQPPIRDIDILDASEVPLTGAACNCLSCGRQGLDGFRGILCEYLANEGTDEFCLVRAAIIRRLFVIADHPVFRAFANVAQVPALRLRHEAICGIPAMIARAVGVGPGCSTNSIRGLEELAEDDLWRRVVSLALDHALQHHPEITNGVLPGNTRRRRRIAAILRGLSSTDLCALARALQSVPRAGKEEDPEARLLDRRLAVVEASLGPILRTKLRKQYQRLAGGKTNWIAYALRDVLGHCESDCVSRTLEDAMDHRHTDYGEVLALVNRTWKDIGAVPAEPRPVSEIAAQRSQEALGKHVEGFLEHLVGWKRNPTLIRDVAVAVWRLVEESQEAYRRELEAYRAELSGAFFERQDIDSLINPSPAGDEAP